MDNLQHNSENGQPVGESGTGEGEQPMLPGMTAVGTPRKAEFDMVWEYFCKAESDLFDLFKGYEPSRWIAFTRLEIKRLYEFMDDNDPSTVIPRIHHSKIIKQDSKEIRIAQMYAFDERVKFQEAQKTSSNEAYIKAQFEMKRKDTFEISIPLNSRKDHYPSSTCLRILIAFVDFYNLLLDVTKEAEERARIAEAKTKKTERALDKKDAKLAKSEAKIKDLEERDKRQLAKIEHEQLSFWPELIPATFRQSNEYFKLSKTVGNFTLFSKNENIRKCILDQGINPDEKQINGKTAQKNVEESYKTLRKLDIDHLSVLCILLGYFQGNYNHSEICYPLHRVILIENKTTFIKDFIKGLIENPMAYTRSKLDYMQKRIWKIIDDLRQLSFVIPYKGSTSFENIFSIQTIKSKSFFIVHEAFLEIDLISDFYSVESFLVEKIKEKADALCWSVDKKPNAYAHKKTIVFKKHFYKSHSKKISRFTDFYQMIFYFVLLLKRSFHTESNELTFETVESYLLIDEQIKDFWEKKINRRRLKLTNDEKEFKEALMTFIFSVLIDLGYLKTMPKVKGKKWLLDLAHEKFNRKIKAILPKTDA